MTITHLAIGGLLAVAVLLVIGLIAGLLRGPQDPDQSEIWDTWDRRPEDPTKNLRRGGGRWN